MKRFQQYYKFIVYFIFCVAVIAVYKTFDSIGVIWNVIKVIAGAISPFAIGFVIAYLLNLPSKKIESVFVKSKKQFVKKKAHGLSILITYLASLVVVVIVIWALVPALSRNILDLYNNIPTYISSVTEYLKNIEIVKKFNLLNDAGTKIYDIINNIFGKFDISQIGKYAQGVFGVTSGIVDMFVAIVASIYMLVDKDKILRTIKRFAKIIFKENVVDLLTVHCKRINEIFTNYIYSRLVCSVIMAIVCGIVLSILKIKYAIILGIFIGAMDMIPYFGSIIACVVSCIVALITGGPWKLLSSGIALLILQQLDGNLLAPKIMGNSLEIGPLSIIFAVTVGGALFGFIGMLFSVPLLAVIRAIINDYMDILEERKLAKQAAEKEEKIE